MACFQGSFFLIGLVYQNMYKKIVFLQKMAVTIC